MLKPDRHMNPDTSVLNISAFILKQLNIYYDVKYDVLLNQVIDNLGIASKENFPYALNFLFLLNKLEYLEKNDSFRYNAIK